MIAHQQQDYLSPEDYLQQEALSPVKHEYIQGQVYAMAGASDAHVTIAGNLFAQLRNHVRGRGCRVYMADMKVQIETRNIYYYPDVLVTCDDRDRDLTDFKRYPCLIVEVLSPKTEAFDRGDKFVDYQELASLKEYVLISQQRRRVDCFRRNPEGLWVLQSYSADQPLHLPTLEFAIAIKDLYEDVAFAQE